MAAGILAALAAPALAWALGGPSAGLGALPGMLLVLALVAWRRQRRRTTELEARLQRTSDRLQRAAVARDYFENVLGCMQGAVILISRDGEIGLVNKTLCTMLGYDEEELLGQPIDLILASAGTFADTGGATNRRRNQGVWKRLFDLIPQRSVKETFFLTRGGREVPVTLSGSVMRDAAGGVSAVVCVAQDRTEALRAKVELQRLARAVEQSTEGVAVTDMRGRIEWHNEAWARMHGHHGESLVRRKMKSFRATAPDAADSGEELRTDADRIESVHLRADGSTFLASSSTTLLTDDGGQPLGYVSIIRDVTREKEAEEQLEAAAHAARARSSQLQDAIVHAERMASEARRANAAKSEFLANLSHEIRTPMNGVIGMLSLLMDTALDVEQLQYASTVQKSARALMSLIDDILDFSKLEAGKMAVVPAPLSLRELIDDVVALHGRRAARRGVEVSVDYDDQLPARLIGDDGRIRQVLGNFVSNAVKFTHEGRIEVSARALERDAHRVVVAISVSDTGIGIAPDKLEHIFDKFTQADASTTRQYGGTGLGLAICRQLSELMGGTVSVDSAPGRGSTFRLELPLPVDPAEGDVPVSAPAPGSAASLEGARVLLAEDNTVNQMVALRMLDKLGCHAELAPDGKRALELMETQRFDAVLMDCQMPNLDGYQATRAIRSREAERGTRTAIIALTANASPGDRRRCLDAGMDDFLAKPIDKDALAEILARWVHVTGRDDETEIFDARRALELFDGDDELLWEVVDTYLADVPARMASLRAALDDGDPARAAREAHSIKGASANIGATRVEELARRLESALVEAGTPGELVVKLERELSRLQGMLASTSRSAA